jgi:NADH:ubiquinone oxidoreductase subunit 6 (subunit J)
MEKTLKQRLLGPICLFIFFITMGINSTIRGVEAHQTWRIILAAVSTAMFAAAVVMIIYKIRKDSKAV